MSVVKHPVFTNEHFYWAVASYPFEPGDVSVEEYAERLRICDACPLQRFGKCGICGCSLVLRAKSGAAVCPRYDPLWEKLPCGR